MPGLSSPLSSSHLTSGPCQITKKQDWTDLFVTPFYFGCEADDKANAWAFKQGANPFNARLNAIFGSDIGHFDVPDMTSTCRT